MAPASTTRRPSRSSSAGLIETPGTRERKQIEPPQLLRLLELAMRAPSGDNAQPWRFVWDAPTLTILHDASRARHFLNLNHNASRLALGCLLEDLTVAASSQGISVDYELLDTKSQQGVDPWTLVRLRPSSKIESNPLVAAIPRRYTDRRPYRPQWIPLETMDGLVATCDTVPGVRCNFIQQPPDEYLRYLLEFDRMLFEIKDLHHDVMEQIRFPGEPNEHSRDGMHWRTLGAKSMDIAVLRLCRNFKIQKLMNALGFLPMYMMNQRKVLRSSALFGCITIKAPSVATTVEAGRLMERLWLRLALDGVSFQPLTISSLLVHDLLTQQLAQPLTGHHRKVLESGSEVLRRTFGLKGDDVPIWMFRAGLPSDERPWVTPRLPIESLVSFEK